MTLRIIDVDDGTAHTLTVGIDSLVGLGTLGPQCLVEVPIGQHLPLVLTIFFYMPLKSALKSLLHFIFKLDDPLLNEPDQLYFCFHRISF